MIESEKNSPILKAEIQALTLQFNSGLRIPYYLDYKLAFIDDPWKKPGVIKDVTMAELHKGKVRASVATILYKVLDTESFGTLSVDMFGLVLGRSEKGTYYWCGNAGNFLQEKKSPIPLEDRVKEIFTCEGRHAPIRAPFNRFTRQVDIREIVWEHTSNKLRHFLPND